MSEPTETSFQAKLKGPSALRIGVVLGAGVVLLLSAVVVMAASPSPSASSGANAPTAPQGPGGPGFGGPGLQMGPGMAGRGAGPMGGKGVRGPGAGPITISAISGSNVSLKTADGWARTIAIGSSTTLTKGGQTITLADLKLNDQVRFHETRASDGSYTIDALEVVVPQVAGTVGTVGSDSFTLKAYDGTTWTINLTGGTTFKLGPNNGAKTDVKAGSDVVVQGTQTSDNTLTALTVAIRLPQAAGEVTAKSGNDLTVKRPDGTTITVHVGSGTTIRVPGVASPGLTDITVGMRIAVQGTQNSDGSLNAVVIGAGKGMGPGFGGTGPGSQG